MHVGFHVARDNNIKFFGPLVDVFQEKGCEVSIFCDYCVKARKMGRKSYQFPAVEKVPQFKRKPNIFSFESVEQLAGIVKQNGVDVVFFMNLPPISSQLKKLLQEKNYSFVMAELQHYYDMMLLKNDVSIADVIYFYSDSWTKSWKEYIKGHNQLPEESKMVFSQQIDDRSSYVGFPEIDQTTKFNKDEICEKHNIARGKKVVLLFSFPKFTSIWIDSVYKKQPAFLKKIKLFFKDAKEYLPDVEKKIDDFTVTKGLRDFCDKNNALLLTKGRIKNPVPKYVKKMSDRVFFDESFYPFLTLELLAIADLSISFCSMTVLESIALGTPSICIMPHSNRMWQPYEILGLPSDFKMDKGSIYNYPGSVYMKSAEEMANGFGSESFENYAIDPASKKNYVKKFLGFDDLNSSKRIYEDICHRVENFENGAKTC